MMGLTASYVRGVSKQGSNTQKMDSLATRGKVRTYVVLLKEAERYNLAIVVVSR